MKRGRKPKFNDQNTVSRKRRKNSNERYYASNGKLVESVNFKDRVCSCLKDFNAEIPVNSLIFGI